MSEFMTVGEPMVVLASLDTDASLEQSTHFEKFLAGAEFNVAIGVSRLGHSAKYISSVGDDPFGHYLIDSAAAMGIDVSDLNVNTRFLTGWYLKQRVSQGDPGVAYFRRNSAAANVTAADFAVLDMTGLKLAHLSGIFAALSPTTLGSFRSLNQKLNNAGVVTVFDPNLRLPLWESQASMVEITNDLAAHSDIVLPGENEGVILAGSSDPETIADFYLGNSELTHTVVVKTGASGAYVKQKSGESFSVPGFEVDQVVDTVGAGDGFAVGLETALLEGKPLDVAVRRACAVGALAVQAPGDNDGYPTREQLHDFYVNNNYEGDI